MSNVDYKKHKTFFLLLKTAYQKKQKFFLYPENNPTLLLILKKLQENSFILGYVPKNNFEIQIFLRYDARSLPAINALFLFPKSRSVSKKLLNAIKNDYPFSFSLLHTQFGILDMNECQKKNCGGELIVTIR